MKSRRRIAFTKAGTTPNRTRLQQGFPTGGMGPTGILLGNNPQDRMSPLGQKQTSRHLQPMSALPPKADIRGRHCDVRFMPKADMRTPRANAVVADRPRPPEHRQPIISGLRNEFSHGRAGVTESIRSIYADDGTQWQEIATPPQHGRIKAGGATTVQKQSVLASKLIPEKTRELA